MIMNLNGRMNVAESMTLQIQRYNINAMEIFQLGVGMAVVPF